MSERAPREWGSSTGEITIPFRLRGVDGRVVVGCRLNEDPERWGFQHLGLPFDIGTARGFPVIEASVDYEAEGYAAFLSWIQVVRMWTADTTEPEASCDVAPQMRGTGVPFMSFGVLPLLFDAPVITEPRVKWRAIAFLTATPNVAMTKVIEPVCGFEWGYDVDEGEVSAVAPSVAGSDQWSAACTEVLMSEYPEWHFEIDR
jgi:hypothetical protein